MRRTLIAVAAVLAAVAALPASAPSVSAQTPFADSTQQDLARMVGVTRESVNKDLGAFKARGLIEMRDRRIVICRPQELRRRVY